MLHSFKIIHVQLYSAKNAIVNLLCSYVIWFHNHSRSGYFAVRSISTSLSVIGGLGRNLWLPKRIYALAIHKTLTPK